MSRAAKLTHLLAADLAQSSARLGAPFREALGVDYARLTRQTYDRCLRSGGADVNVEVLISDACDRLKPANFFSSSSEDVVDGEKVEKEVALGTRLFELYLALQKFYRGGDENEDDTVGWRSAARPPDSDSGNESSSVGSDEAAANGHSVRVVRSEEFEYTGSKRGMSA